MRLLDEACPAPKEHAMIDPAPLTHEPSDAEIARRIALLDLPVDDPRRLWEPFARHLDHPTALTTALLQRWLGGRPVTVTDLLTREERGRQYRVVTLVTTVDGEQVPLCHASAVVELRLLPGWARDVLTRTERPLARTLHLAGAVRDRTTATVLDADPDAPGDAGLKVRGAFRLPGDGGRMAAVVEEFFTGYVLELQQPHTVPDRDSRRPDDLDEALVRILRRRRALADARARLQHVAPDGSSTDDGLLSQLVQLFRSTPPTSLPTRTTDGESVGRPGA